MDEENPLLPDDTATATTVPNLPHLGQPQQSQNARYYSIPTGHAGLGLRTFAYLIEPDTGLRPVTVHEALHHRSNEGQQQQQQQHAWIDAILYDNEDDNHEQQQSATTAATATAYQELHRIIFDHLSVSTFLRRHLNQLPRLLQTPQVLSLTNALLMVMRIIPNNDTTNNYDGQSAASYTAVLCLEEGLMVSITKATTTASSSSSRPNENQEDDGGSATPPPAQPQQKQQQQHDNDAIISWRHQRHCSSSRAVLGLGTTLDNNSRTVSGSFLDRNLIDPSLSGCLVMYLSYHLEETAAATHRLRTQVLQMLTLLDTDNIAAVRLSHVVELKNALMRLSAVAEEQHQCILRLVDADDSNDSFNFVKGSVHVLLSLASSTERMVDRLEARMNDIKDGYESFQQERIKKRLNLLTVLSAVFLPLTLMAGIWGMNFRHMPELSTPFGYYYALTSMVIVALGLMSCFYWNGWFS